MKGRILIPGGSGFIGSHLVEELIKKGYYVTVLDLWKAVEFENLDQKKFQFIKMNVNELSNNTDILDAHEHLIYFASILGTSETITTYPIPEVISTNTLTPVKLMETFCKSGKKMIIPITPEVDWLNPYKITKKATEEFSKLYSHQWNHNIICIRLGNVYGPRERWEGAAKYNNFKYTRFNYQKIIPTFIMNTLNDCVVSIYGSGE